MDEKDRWRPETKKSSYLEKRKKKPRENVDFKGELHLVMNVHTLVGVLIKWDRNVGLVCNETLLNHIIIDKNVWLTWNEFWSPHHFPQPITMFKSKLCLNQDDCWCLQNSCITMSYCI